MRRALSFVIDSDFDIYEFVSIHVYSWLETNQG
jgi:hypothetical protein